MQGIASQPKSKKPRIDPDTGKSSPLLDPNAWSLEKAFEEYKSQPDTLQNEEPSGWVNKELIRKELGLFFADITDLNFNLDDSIVNMALPFSDNSSSNLLGGFLPSTADNPQGLPENTRNMIDFYASNPLLSIEDGFDVNSLSHYEKLHYEFAKEKFMASSSGPQLVAANLEYEARLAKTKEYFSGTNNSPWHLPVSRGLNDGLMGIALWNRPLQFTRAYAGYQTADIAGSAYQNREQIAQIYNEAKQNGGMTLAVGVTPSGTIASAQGAFAVGGWISADFNNMNINGGGYWSIEGGPKLGLADLNYDVGLETTVFTSSRYEGALTGTYQVFGAGYNQSSMSYIRADSGAINGYQMTWDFHGRSYMNYKHDGNVYLSTGYGNILWGGRKIMIHRRAIKPFISFGVAVVIGAIILWDINNINQAQIHINEFANLNPSIEYQTKTIHTSLKTVVPQSGKVGDFYHCLKSYKPSLGWLSPKEGQASGIQLFLDGGYLLDLSVTQSQAYEVFFSKYDHDNNRLWKTNVAINCDLGLLNKTQRDLNTRLLNQLNGKTVYKELYTSNPELPLPKKNQGRLGTFYSCLTKHNTWDYKTSVAERGMIKLDLAGYILHLGVIDNKAVNFSIERYGLKRETIALSKIYQVDCDLNLLDS